MATMREQRIAAELRTLRGSLTSTDVKRGVGMHPSKLSRIESCSVRPQPDDVRQLATFYGASVETIERLVRAAESAQQPAWWTEYVGPDWNAALVHHLELESEASRIDSWTIDLVPGLLQVPSYIRALINNRPDVSPDQMKRRLDLRARRQERVTSGQLELWAVVGETVLRQAIGGAAVLADQLQALHDAPGNVTVQVLPFAAGAHPGLGSSFHLLRFADWPSVVYQDTITTGLYRDDLDITEAHKSTMEHIRAAALSPHESRELLQERVRELTR